MLKTTPAAHYSSACISSLSESERNALIEAHLPQVKYIVERIAAKLPQSVDRDDLIGAGLFGLFDATSKFDPSRGVQFRTYAESRVRGAILDSLRNLDWASRSLRQRGREVQAAYDRIEAQHGRPATEEEVAEYLEMPLPEFQSLLGRLSFLTVSRLDEEDEEGNGSLARNIPADPASSPSALYERREERELLIAAIDRLPERERQVVALYYVEELTMKEIGAVLGITESRVCQIHTKAVLHLRSALASQNRPSDTVSRRR